MIAAFATERAVIHSRPIRLVSRPEDVATVLPNGAYRAPERNRSADRLSTDGRSEEFAPCVVCADVPLFSHEMELPGSEALLVSLM